MPSNTETPSTDKEDAQFIILMSATIIDCDNFQQEKVLQKKYSNVFIQRHDDWMYELCISIYEFRKRLYQSDGD